jgi:hypothetical protein
MSSLGKGKRVMNEVGSQIQIFKYSEPVSTTKMLSACGLYVYVLWKEGRETVHFLSKAGFAWFHHYTATRGILDSLEKYKGTSPKRPKNEMDITNLCQPPTPQLVDGKISQITLC